MRRYPSRAEASSTDAALEVALRALRHRDRTAADIDRLLESKGVGEDERREVLETLVRTALVDDVRYAESRAFALAERGAGNDLVRDDLERSGIDPRFVSDAIGALDDECERARGIVDRRGASPKTARYLASKGFSDDVVRSAVASGQDEALG